MVLRQKPASMYKLPLGLFNNTTKYSEPFFGTSLDIPAIDGMFPGSEEILNSSN